MSATNAPKQALVAEDLARVATPLDLARLQGSSVVITGGSGFMGLWMTELLVYLSKAHKLDLRLHLVARDFASAKVQAPHLFDGKAPVSLIHEDVRTLHDLPQDADWLIHAAASPDARVHNSQPIDASQTITQGTLNVLLAATRLPKLKGLLNVSSGYVYGYHSQGEDGERAFEGFDPSVFASSYMEAKRYAESLCTIIRNQHRLPLMNVRPFSFVGPYQSLDAPWAVNNFIHDAVKGQPIRIQGDGSAVRSYMYGADMAWWLLNMLLRGQAGANYNLGSADGVTLKELAERIRVLANAKLELRHASALPKAKASVFVPSPGQLKSELGLSFKFDLDQALARTIQWYS